MACAPSEDSDQPGQSSLCAQWVANDPSFLHADNEYSDQTGRRIRRTHMPFCRFCRAAAQIMISNIIELIRNSSAVSTCFKTLGIGQGVVNVRARIKVLPTQ